MNNLRRISLPYSVYQGIYMGYLHLSFGLCAFWLGPDVRFRRKGLGFRVIVELVEMFRV